ncbi:MAG: RdgB/HAM1 family non-canonical purine NTP pyrophosphatase [Butyrivibrio sp.]|nr:RdgB/HAM1 family non-canonical purine NTP pyrophosphatase [Butyrivibrio sp.]
MMKIVFATGNKDKLREIREILGDIATDIVSMKEAGADIDVDENGNSFEENSKIKVLAVQEYLKANSEEYKDAVIMSDDSGLEVDYLNKEPGIYSARYLGKDTSYTEKNNNIIERLSGVPDEKRTARFVCAVSAALPSGEVLTVRGTMEGRIGYEIAGENGFGYDPIFVLPELGKTSAEITEEEKNALSHRGKALRMMAEKLKEIGELI